MANLWIWRSTGLITDPDIVGQAIPYPDNAEVTVSVSPLAGWLYDYCIVVRDTTGYRVLDSAVTVVMDVDTNMTFVGHLEGEPPPDGTVWVRYAGLLVPVAVAAGVFIVSRFL